MEKKLVHSAYRISICFIFVFLFVSLFAGCNPFFNRFITKSLQGIDSSIDIVDIKISNPILPKVGLSVLWIGHSSFLIQIGEKIFLTDPVFTNSVGMILRRKIEAGLSPKQISKLDYILISHPRFDHLNYGSLTELPKSATMIFPKGVNRYIPEMGFLDYIEMQAWTTFNSDSVRITAIPVKHFNGRYGFDHYWSNQDSYTGYIIECDGKIIFFAGDTGYDPDIFKGIGNKFNIDLALLPIAPIEPHNFMRRVHTDPKEAIQIFYDLQAKVMIPTHHLTFVQGLDSSLSYAQNQLVRLSSEHKINENVLILKIGEQKILIP